MRTKSKPTPRQRSAPAPKEKPLDGVLAFESAVAADRSEAHAALSAKIATLLAEAREKNLDPAPIVAAAVLAFLPGTQGPGKGARTDTREKILASALKEFGERGYHQTTIDRIAEQAGLGKGTVFHHFPSKEALFDALIEEKTPLLVQRARDAFFREADLFQAIRAATRAYLEFFESDINHYRVLMQAPFDLQKKMRDLYMQSILANMPAVRQRIVREANAGNVRNVDFYTVFYGYMGFLEGVLQRWIYGGGRGSLVAELDVIMQILLGGIVADNSPLRRSSPPFSHS